MYKLSKTRENVTIQEKTTPFTVLPESCILGVLKRLHLTEIAQVAKTNRYLKSVALRHLRKLYNEQVRNANGNFLKVLIDYFDFPIFCKWAVRQGKFPLNDLALRALVSVDPQGKGVLKYALKKIAYVEDQLPKGNNYTSMMSVSVYFKCITNYYLGAAECLLEERIPVPSVEKEALLCALMVRGSKETFALHQHYGTFNDTLSYKRLPHLEQTLKFLKRTSSHDPDQKFMMDTISSLSINRLGNRYV